MPANIVFSGITNDFFEQAFDDANIISITSDEIRAVDESTGFTTTVGGTNFSLPPGSDEPTGTMTSLLIADANANPVISITGISWDVTVFLAAIDDLLENDGEEGLLALLLSQDTVNLDASGADIGAEFRFDELTRAVTITGSSNEDTLGGGLGSDSINPGAAPQFEGDVIFGSAGNDTVNFGSIGDESYVDVTYEDVAGPVTITVNGPRKHHDRQQGRAGHGYLSVCHQSAAGRRAEYLWQRRG
ncbi:hypothetical protein [Sulfitobacter sp. S190]|uniref:hypothetical protein n=1 Tax=Sulfitobacter sp. S190 TaxID=2867022 RepID=UPI0021A8CB37|nr:hypothetical protein [Sulfitobacter sp. S190]UWR24431.1 hypothetical protein K3756_18190 [Sulfitobacter sp. S190]